MVNNIVSFNEFCKLNESSLSILNEGVDFCFCKIDGSCISKVLDDEQKTEKEFNKLHKSMVSGERAAWLDDLNKATKYKFDDFLNTWKGDHTYYGIINVMYNTHYDYKNFDRKKHLDTIKKISIELSKKETREYVLSDLKDEFFNIEDFDYLVKIFNEAASKKYYLHFS